MYDSLEVVEKGERLKSRKRVCKDCVILLTLSGSLRASFIVALSPESNFTCEICNTNQAVFAVAPYENGLILCSRCLEDRGNKHVWNRFKTEEVKGDVECDLCGRNGEKRILPTFKRDLPVDLEES